MRYRGITGGDGVGEEQEHGMLLTLNSHSRANTKPAHALAGNSELCYEHANTKSTHAGAEKRRIIP